MVVLDGEMKCTPAGPPCGKGDIPPVANPGYVAREATTTTTSTPSTGLNINQIRGDCDRYCQVMNNDEDSYCKWWLEYAVCIGGDQPCGTQSLCELPNKSISPGGPEGDGLYYGECDLMCQSMNNDEGSFCKWWLDVPVCKHGNQACGDVERCRSQDWPKPQGPPTAVNEVTGHPHHSAPCDSFCQSLNDDGSYCKWWKTEPVCRGGDQPCGPSYCSTGEPPGTGTPQDRHSGPDVNCDAYCEDQSPPPTDGESYCKWWLHVPVCKGGDQLCGPSICTEYSPSAP
ncbi:hypothetical protein FOZ61_005600 [Perkinsus olseni]|uniref:Uncharacterized protein n=1 Tax=Perkinsus olseni TaxID=32597 RepID=A0A7J6LGN2_PEROL|nr:hypothetical protein FOZ61_005600 [Perkinsus olseni]